MQDTGFTLAQYAINNVGWTNLNNLLVPDGSYAASTPVTGQASEFTLGGFLFNIPTNSLISGFEIEVVGYRGIDSLPATTFEIWAYDNTNENNAYYQFLPVFTDFGTSVGTYVLGSSTYTFNQVIDWAQANNMKFKFVTNGELYIDSIRVRVFYQEPVDVIVPVSDTCTTLIQAQPFYLQTPIGSNDTTCIVNQFQTSSGRPIFNIDIPNGYPATLDQGKSNEENIIITNIEVLSGNRRQLTISRGWSDTDPVGQDVSLRKPHGSGAELTLSNNIEFYDLFLRKCHIGSLVSAPVTFRFNNTQIASYVRDINVTGSGVTASAVSHIGSGGGQDVTININGNNTVPPVVNGSSSGNSGNVLVNTLTYNTHAITGTNRATLVSVSMSSGVALSGVTLGGNAMTFIGANNSGGVRIEDWVLVNPPLGIQPVVITVAASATSYLASTQTTWNGATQTTPFTLATTNDGTDNDSEGNATTTVNNSIVVHTLATALPSIAYSAGSGENLIVTNLTGQVQSGIQTLDVGVPSTQTSVINLSQNATWGNIILTLAPVPVIGDKFVAVTSADTTPSYLSDKVQAGANITLSVINPGGNEKLQITSSGGGGGGLTGVQNVGGGDGEVFRDITGGDTINLKTLESSDGSVTITDNANTIDLTVTSPSGGTASGLQYLPNTGLFYGFGLDQVLMSVNPEDSTRSEYIFYTGGNTAPLNICLAILNSAGQYQWSRIIQISTVSNEQVSVAIDNTYIWVTRYIFGVSTTIYAYTRAGVLTSTNVVTNLGIAGTLGGSISIGNKLFVVVQTSPTNGVLFEFALSGSTATTTANYSLTGLVAYNFTTNIYKETSSNTNILFIGKNGTVLKDYSTNATISTPTFDTFYVNSRPGNASQYVFYRPDKSDYLNLAGWDTNLGSPTAAMYGNPLLGMPFEAGHLSL